MHHKVKLRSTSLVVYCFSSQCILATLVDLQTSLSSFFSKDLQGGHVLSTFPCVFTHEFAANPTQITIAAWIQGFPQMMIVENAESTESAITSTAHSTNPDNIVSSLEKENPTLGTLCSCPSSAI